MRSPTTLRERVRARMTGTSEVDVFLPRDFVDLGGKGQVSRALRQLVREGSLIRLGYGVYARAFRSRLTGRPIVAHPNGFHGAALQAVDRLGFAWEPGERWKAYDDGLSTQIPLYPAARIETRFRRRLSDGRTELRVERGRERPSERG